MKLELVIKNIIQNNKIKTQNELTKFLRARGVSTTQSNISRILKKLNTVKIVDENREIYYVIHSKPLEIVEWVSNLIMSIEHNGCEIVLKTYAGSAAMIARLIEERNLDDILAVIAGYDSVLVIPRNIKTIQNLVEKLRNLFPACEK